MNEFETTLAEKTDCEAILALQKLCYRQEAEIYDDFEIPPLTQTLPEILEEFDGSVFFKAVSQGEIIGSVRAVLKNGECQIGRLIVHPDRQNSGLGTRLMNAAETRFASQCEKYVLFTGQESEKNIHLYQKLGYAIVSRQSLGEKVTIVNMEKLNAEKKPGS